MIINNIFRLEKDTRGPLACVADSLVNVVVDSVSDLRQPWSPEGVALDDNGKKYSSPALATSSSAVSLSSSARTEEESSRAQVKLAEKPVLVLLDAGVVNQLTPRDWRNFVDLFAAIAIGHFAAVGAVAAQSTAQRLAFLPAMPWLLSFLPSPSEHLLQSAEFLQAYSLSLASNGAFLIVDRLPVERRGTETQRRGFLKEMSAHLHAFIMVMLFFKTCFFDVGLNDFHSVF